MRPRVDPGSNIDSRSGSDQRHPRSLDALYEATASTKVCSEEFYVHYKAYPLLCRLTK